jgi:hypothetical protein
LLEQHQAPITAALTPAFSADSTPEILASAVHACAIFVGCGVVKDINRMGRILKLLTSALEQSKGNCYLDRLDKDLKKIFRLWDAITGRNRRTQPKCLGDAEDINSVCMGSTSSSYAAPSLP